MRGKKLLFIETFGCQMNELDSELVVGTLRRRDFSCTYCIVPTTRGAEISRQVEELRDEVYRLAADGVKEVTLLGQTVDSYGKGLPGRPDLGTLLAAIHDAPGLERVRFITS